jgi:hypothetical protein
MNYKIPKSFELFGNTIKVSFNKSKTRELSALGAFSSNINELILTDICDQGKLPKDVIYQTFLHELTHAILFKLSKDDIAKDEIFVEQFAQLLYQYLKTAKY